MTTKSGPNIPYSKYCLLRNLGFLSFRYHPTILKSASICPNMINHRINVFMHLSTIKALPLWSSTEITNGDGLSSFLSYRHPPWHQHDSDMSSIPLLINGNMLPLIMVLACTWSGVGAGGEGPLYTYLVIFLCLALVLALIICIGIDIGISIGIVISVVIGIDVGNGIDSIWLDWYGKYW